jgi:hypothetical protein
VKKSVYLLMVCAVLVIFIAACKHVTPTAITQPTGSISGQAYAGAPMSCGPGGFIPVIIQIPTSTGTVTPYPTVPVIPTSTPTPRPPLAGTTVELLQNNVVIASTITAADGSYSFANVQPGDYIVSCFYPGYQWIPMQCTVNEGHNTAMYGFSATYMYAPCQLFVAFTTATTFSDAIALLATYGCISSNTSFYGTSTILSITFPSNKTISEMQQTLGANPSITETEASVYMCPD